jgi:hypothetical protein
MMTALARHAVPHVDLTVSYTRPFLNFFPDTLHDVPMAESGLQVFF